MENNCQHGVLVHDCYYCSGGNSARLMVSHDPLEDAKAEAAMWRTKAEALEAEIARLRAEPSTDGDLKTAKENMDEFAAMTKMWIAFHEARPEVSLVWFIQHYRDGELLREIMAVAEPPSAPAPATEES